MSPEIDVSVRPRTHSLNEVRAVIPPACYQRSTRRAAWALAQAVVLWVAPLAGIVLIDRWWALLVLWPLAGLGVAGLFVLGHDASHASLVDSRSANRIIARLCMAPSAHVEAAWDLGHNRIHHGYTTRQGFDFVWHPATPAEFHSMGRLARLRHRFEWSWCGSGAYFLRTVWWQKMWRHQAAGRRHDAIRRDKRTLGAALFGVGAVTALLGAATGGWVDAFWLPVELFVVPFLVFVHIIGWTVYVHHVAPDVRWWSRREWTQYRGQMESTTILQLPRLLNRLWFHNIFVHVPHHVDARIPFHQLPAAGAAIAAAFPDTVRSSKVSLRGYLRATTTCKLYDFESGEWRPYASPAR